MAMHSTPAIGAVRPADTMRELDSKYRLRVMLLMLCGAVDEQ
jgi:hypothetical protein